MVEGEPPYLHETMAHAVCLITQDVSVVLDESSLSQCLAGPAQTEEPRELQQRSDQLYLDLLTEGSPRASYSSCPHEYNRALLITRAHFLQLTTSSGEPT